MTKQEVKDAISGCAASLKHVPTLTQLVEMTPVSHRQVRRHFGGYARALRECNLPPQEIGRGAEKLSLEKLFVEWAGMVRALQKIPSLSDYEMLSAHTCKPLLRRFGSWHKVPQGLKEFAESRGLAEDWKNELDLVKPWGSATVESAAPAVLPEPTFKLPVYGPPIWPWPLAYAPVNELGVVFLFGVLAWQLGFVVHRMQAAFPDCEAMRRVGDKWQLTKSEFEFESRNFLRHMHKANECDLIICWKHNWPECPLEVLELSKEIAKMARMAGIPAITAD